MASLLRRTVILSFSRFANQAIVLFSPLLLVRILTVVEYGAYREFLLYAAIVCPMVSFGIARSLPFLLPRYPEAERTWITQTVILVAAFSTMAIVAVFVVSDIIRSKTSFDFVIPLQLYIVFFVNLDFIELYWLGKKRAENVLYYSTTRLLGRTVAVIATAYVTESASAIIYSLIVLEMGRFLLVLLYSISRRWYTSDLSRDTWRRQISYFLPLGIGANIETLRSNVGTLFISLVLGAEALAFYVIGVFATKIADILRGAIADVIFPDMVEIRSALPKDALPLWRRATIWYCILLFPSAVGLSYYADAIVITLFTDQYVAAIPVFSTIAFLLVLFCFDFHLPLRVQNANRFFLLGSAFAFVANLVFLYPLFLVFGIVGPAVASLCSQLTMSVYLANRTLHIYGIGIRELVLWREVGKVLVAALAALPILVAGKHLLEDLLLRGVVFGTLYLSAYYMVLRALSVEESEVIVRAIGRMMRWPRPASK